MKLLALLVCAVLVVGTTASIGETYNKWKTFVHNAWTRHSNDENSSVLGKMIREGLRDWLSYKGIHGKTFTDEDEEHEHMISFIRAKEHVNVHNDAYDQHKTSFKIAVNHLADLPYDEYARLNGYRRQLLGAPSTRNSTNWLAPMNVRVPEEVDWRDHDYVTDVKNQGMCGSCYSYSATGSLEGQHKRRTGKLVSLSEQNIVDCSTAFGNNGCNGGLMDFAFEYIKHNRGIDTEDSYPYKGRQGRCHFRKADVGADDTGYVDLPEGDEDALRKAVATQGPISVAIDAGHRSFQLYREGVYYERNCSPENLDHGVLVVGYGTDPEHGDYWIVKNSWGPEWGEEGYIKMARNKDNHCGIASKASYPLV